MKNENGDQKKSIDEDWAASRSGFQMKAQTEDAVKTSLAPRTYFIEDNDSDTLEPEDKTAKKEESGEWKTPEPIFRTSSGNTFTKRANKAFDDLSFSSDTSAAKNLNGVTVKQQPNDKITEKASVESGSVNFNKTFVVLTAIILAIALVATLYFWFFYKSQM